MVTRLAEAKARAATAQMAAGKCECVIVGADTTVELDGEIFGKPRDSSHAREMLARLADELTTFLREFFFCDCRTIPLAPQSKIQQ